MPAVQRKSMNWLPKPSAWAEMQAWRQRRNAVSDNFAATSSAVVQRFADTVDAQASGGASIAISRANARIQAEIQARYATILDVSA
jgi:hypothetical protein